MSLTPATSTPIHAGEILAGKYRVESLLGDGGMGVVLGAVNVGLQTRVAVKLLNSEAEQDEAVVSRFLREGKAAARLRSEHVAQVLDIGTLADGRPYLVTEWLDGTDLAHLIRRHGPLDVGYAVELVLQTCEGLAEAHAAGIIHRDLKPANLFLTQRSPGVPLVKILDFGVCKVAGPEDRALTKAHEVLGTPKYMSPEQLTASRDIDARTDIWALGVILYELLTKRPPFDDTTLTGLMTAVRTKTPPKLHELRGEIPVALSEVAFRCLQKRREDRYASAADLARDLEAVLASIPGVAAAPDSTTGRTVVLESPRHLRAIPSAPPASGALPSTAFGPVGRPFVRIESGPIPVVPRSFEKYVMHGPLAAGGMASVHYGTVVEGDGVTRPVALKRVRDELAVDANFATMLTDEARIAGRVRHPNVVATLDIIKDEGGPIIALEYVPGVSLALLLRSLRARHTPIPIAIAARFIVDVLAGLHAAHEARDVDGRPLDIVHRDISPQNILLHEQGVAKIADFGVAMARGRLQRTTETGTLKGKLGYLAPEQIQGQISRSCDIYAVAAVAWELLVGQPLFEGSEGEMLAAAMSRELTPPSRAGRDEAAPLDAAVMKGLARSPAERFPTALAMREAIESSVVPASPMEVASFLEATLHDELEKRRAIVRSVLAGGSTALATGPRPRVTPVPDRSQHRGWLFIAIGLVGIGVLAAMASRLAGGAKPVASSAAATATAPPTATTATTTTTADPPATAPAVESAAPSASISAPSASISAPSATVSAPLSAPSATPPPRATAHPPFAAPRSKKPAANTPDCTPPYTISEGRTIWKRECFK